MRSSGAYSRPAVTLFGTRGPFTRSAAEEMLNEGIRMEAIVIADDASASFRQLPAPAVVASDLPMVASYVENSVVELGWTAGIPVWNASPRAEDMITLTQQLAPCMAVVACWPARLPAAVLQIPRNGFLNIHPSMLPDFRGPAPLFWQLRMGLRKGGVSIHIMSEALDQGPLLAQAPLHFPVGATGPMLDAEAGHLGAHLLRNVLDDYTRGTLRGKPQEQGDGTYQSWPTEADFDVPTSWSALRAWNFMRGTTEWGIPHTLVLPDSRLIVEELVNFDEEATLDRPVIEDGYTVAVRFEPGVIWVRGPGVSP